MTSLSFVGLAAALGNAIDIPLVTRNLAIYYEHRTPGGTNFILDSKSIEYLVSGAQERPDCHVRNYTSDWWTDKKKKIGLDYKTAHMALVTHRIEIENLKTDVTDNVEPPAPSVLQDRNMYKGNYGWHSGTFDKGGGNDCVNCRLYRSITLGVWDKLRDLRNIVDGLESFHRTERNMTERRAVGLNLLYEEAVIKESRLVETSSKGAEKSYSPAAVASAGDAVDPSSKWTWGVDLDVVDLREMVRASDNNFVLPHSGYDESLGESTLLSETDNPTPSLIQELEDEVASAPLYEPLSADIRHERELGLHEFPLAFNNFPLNSGAGVKSDFQRTASIKPRMWLEFPPAEYVSLPIPPFPSTIHTVAPKNSCLLSTTATTSLSPPKHSLSRNDVQTRAVPVDEESDIEVRDIPPTFVVLESDPGVTAPPMSLELDDDIYADIPPAPILIDLVDDMVINGPVKVHAPTSVDLDEDIVVYGPHPSRPPVVIDLEDDTPIVTPPSFVDLGEGEDDSEDDNSSKMEGILCTMPTRHTATTAGQRTDAYTAKDFEDFDPMWLDD
jgi:hypothetical protein